MRTAHPATLLCVLLLTIGAPGRVEARAPEGPAETMKAAEQALSAWNMASARAAIARYEAMAESADDTWAIRGRLALFEGRYDDAVDLLTRAAATAGPDSFTAHLGAMARAVAAETRGYQERLTSGGHFVIRWSPGVDEVMVPWMDRVLEAAWEALTAQFEHTPEVPVRVEIYPRAETLAAVTPLTEDEIRQSGTIALCKYNRLMITSPRALVYGYDWADTVVHEFIHMLITQRSNNTVPIWLHEGLAKYYESAWRTDTAPRLDPASESLLATALANDELVPFEAMSPSMAKLPSQEVTATAFAEVHTVIDFLRQRHGDDLPRSLTSAMATGKSDKEVVAQLAKMPWDRFEPAWRHYLKRQGLKSHKDRFDARLLFKGHDTEADELALLKGEQARRFVWLGDRLTLKERHLAASKEYAKAAATAQEPVPLIQAKLGRALLKQDRVAEAITELEKSLKDYPHYMLIRLYLGEAWLRQGDPAKAQAHLEAAVLINPFDPQLHDHLRMTYEAIGEEEEAAIARDAHAKVMAHRTSIAP